jgi:subtilisin family serine protease
MVIEDLTTHISTVLGGAEPTFTYTAALKGFAAPLSPEQILTVQSHPQYLAIEEDQMMHAIQTCTEQHQQNSWGQSRVSERDLPIRPTFFTGSDGRGIEAYIIDTGIRVDHNEFRSPTGARAAFGFKANSSWTDTDGNGHGTHVAGTVGGNTVGLANQVSLYAVKVLGDNGSGTNAGVIAGVDWVTARQRANPGRKYVANMSLGGGFSSALNTACNTLVSAGTFLAVAAGNDNGNACNNSPASAAETICTGSTGRYEAGGPAPYDVRSSFSNWGTCVHIMAPGALINASWNTAANAYRVISGTSMASPHVCGTAALYWSSSRGSAWTVAQLKARLTGQATLNKIDMLCTGACGQTVNRLLFTDC